MPLLPADSVPFSKVKPMSVSSLSVMLTDGFYSSLQSSFNFNPVVVDGTKGLIIDKQNDDQTQWLNTWLLDTDKTEKNTKITIRNDFSYQWVDWRNKGQHDQKVGKI